MKKPVGRNIKILRYLCLIAIVSLGLLTIVGSNGGSDGDSDTTTSDDSNGSGGSDCNLSLSVSTTSSSNPTYSWTGGDVMVLNVLLRSNLSTPVWQIATSDSNGISSSVTHGTIPSSATENIDTETSLSAGTEYRVIISKVDTSCVDYADFTTSVDTTDTSDDTTTSNTSNSSELPFTDNFNDGKWMDEWHQDLGNNADVRVIDDTTFADDKMLEISGYSTDTINDVNKVTHTFTNAVYPTYIKFWVKTTSENIKALSVVFGGSSLEDNTNLMVYFGPSGRIYAINDNSLELVGHYEADKWEKIELKSINWSNKTYKFFHTQYGDSELEFPLTLTFGNSSSANGIKKIGLFNSESTAVSYFDGITMEE